MSLKGTGTESKESVFNLCRSREYGLNHSTLLHSIEKGKIIGLANGLTWTTTTVGREKAGDKDEWHNGLSDPQT